MSIKGKTVIEVIKKLCLSNEFRTRSQKCTKKTSYTANIKIYNISMYYNESTVKLLQTVAQFGCSIDAPKQQMALNFE